MIWIVLKPFRVRRGSEDLILLPGEQIPEAEEWHNSDYWTARGFIKQIDERPLLDRRRQKKNDLELQPRPIAE